MLRYLGSLVVILGVVIVGVDAYVSMILGDGTFQMRALGEWWVTLHADSLQLIGPAVERHVPAGPWVYEHLIQPVLLWPAAIEAFVLGVVLIVLGLLLR